MREHAVDAVGYRRTGRATGLVPPAEHEVVDEQLGPPVEQIDERLLALVRVEAVLLVNLHPGELASQPRELVAESRVLLLADEQLLSGGEPLLARTGRVIVHVFLPRGSMLSPESASPALC